MIKYTLFFISIAAISNAKICGNYYQHYFKNNHVIESNYTIKISNFESELLTFEIPKNTPPSDIQIEVYGDQDIRYLISKLVLNDSEVLISDQKGTQSSDYISDKELSLIDNFPGSNDEYAFNSKVRSIPGYEKGYASVIIPHELTSKLLKSKKEFKIKLNTNLKKDHSAEIRVVFRKALPIKKTIKLDLDLSIPREMIPKFEEKLSSILIENLNEIYSLANIKFSLSKQFKILEQEDNNIDIDKQTPPASLSMKDPMTPNNLRIQLCESLFSCALGNIAGYSRGLPGPSSEQGRKNMKVFISIPYWPQSNNTEQIYYWSVETANILAHELGHYFGLHHTFELHSKKIVDNISDTPTTESNNIMNPTTNRGSLMSLSPEQVKNLRSHPIVTDKN